MLTMQISRKLYEPYIREVPLFKDCSYGFIKQIVISQPFNNNISEHETNFIVCWFVKAKLN